MPTNSFPDRLNSIRIVVLILSTIGASVSVCVVDAGGECRDRKAAMTGVARTPQRVISQSAEPQTFDQCISQGVSTDAAAPTFW